MAFASKYNKGNPTFKVKLHEPAYTTLADLHNENGSDHVYPIAGLYINTKGKYGPQGMIAINDSLMVNLPSHLTETVEEMRKDAEAVEAINNGQAGFKIYLYQTKNGRTGYSVNWVDLTD